ncbi:CpaE-like family protein [Flindersiella endophytica]
MAATPTPTPAQEVGRPLLVTADDRVLDDVIRLAAACGMALDVAADVGGARPAWPRAPLVLVGADVTASMLRSAPPRRRGVVLVGHNDGAAFDWPGAVRLGVDEVVLLPEQEPHLSELIAASAAGGGRAEALVIGVVGGRGGAGASVLAVALALAAVKLRLRCTLIDADRLGGGLDALLGAEDCEGVRWPDLATADGRVSASALGSALPVVSGLHLLSCPRGDPHPLPPPAMRAVLGAACRLGDLVVVDLPRHLDEAAEAALDLCTLALLVVPAEVRAVTAAAGVAATLTPRVPDLRLLVRGPAPAGLTALSIAETLALPLAGSLPPERHLAQTLDRGRLPAHSPRSPLARWCRQFLTDLNLPTHQAA